MDQEASAPREIAPGASFAPVPDWVELKPYAIPKTANPHFIAGGACVLLDESQIDLCGPERGWFYRRADMVTAVAGAERAAQFNVTYDPRYERLDIHTVRVWRGGQAIDHVGAPGFEAFRREQNMERLMFDGRQTIAYTLPDVRPGDVVETSYTRTGMRKSLGGRHAAWVPFEWGVGIVEVRFRQRAPKHRVIRERGYNNPPEATERVEGDAVERRWRTFERPAFKYEALTPPWTLQSASLQWSEWRDWADVAAAFTPLYEEADPLPAEVEAEIERIAAAEPTPAGRAAAVLRFCQNAVRYLAISMGEGGFTPRTFSEICSTRYGDCKDKSKLYVAMARKLDLEACPALVNTRDGPALDAYLPSGQLFDHCIVQVKIDGKTYWLDPTREQQEGPLELMQQCYFGWGLPLTPTASALERMPDQQHVHTLHSEEIITLGDKPSTPAIYEWRVTHRGWRAEDLRARIAREGAVGLFKLYANDITRTLPGALPIQQEVVSDDLATNTITTLERYEISQPWIDLQSNRVAFSTHDFYLRAMLAKLDPGPRKNLIYLGHVGRVTRRVEINLKTDWPSSGFTRRVTGADLTFEALLKQPSPRKLELTQRLDIRAWSIPASDAEKYREVIAELERADLVLSSNVRMGKFVKAGGGIAGKAFNAIRIAFLIAVGLAWLVALLSRTAPLPP